MTQQDMLGQCQGQNAVTGLLSHWQGKKKKKIVLHRQHSPSVFNLVILWKVGELFGLLYLHKHLGRSALGHAQGNECSPMGKQDRLCDSGCLAMQGLPGEGEEVADEAGDPVPAGGEVAGRQLRTDDLVPPRLKRGADGGICFLAQCNGSCCTWEGSV